MLPNICPQISLSLLTKNSSRYFSTHVLKFNNAITDGGVAPPEILLTIVMVSSNLKSLRISRNSKDCREG